GRLVRGRPRRTGHRRARAARRVHQGARGRARGREGHAARDTRRWACGGGRAGARARDVVPPRGRGRYALPRVLRRPGAPRRLSRHAWGMKLYSDFWPRRSLQLAADALAIIAIGLGVWLAVIVGSAIAVVAELGRQLRSAGQG